MVVQRDRGQVAVIEPQKVARDKRGNVHFVPDPEHAFERRAWTSPQRSARAEAPGQLAIDIVRVGIAWKPADTQDIVGLWARVRFRGELWDVAAPPALHWSQVKRLRHWSIDLRRRGSSRVDEAVEEGAP